MNTRYFYLLRFALAGCDLILFNACLLLGFYFTREYNYFSAFDSYLGSAFVGSMIWLLSAYACNLYSQATVQKYLTLRKAGWKTLMLHSFVFLVYLLAKDFTALYVALFFFCIALNGFGLLASRFVGNLLFNVFDNKFNFRKAVAILHSSPIDNKLAHYFENQRTINFRGFLSNDANYRSGSAADFTLAQLKLAADLGVEEIYVTVNLNQINDYAYLIAESDRQCMRVKFVPDLTTTSTYFNIGKIDGFPMLSLQHDPL